MLVSVQAGLAGSEGRRAQRVSHFRKDVCRTAIAWATQINNVAVSWINGDRHVIGTLTAAEAAGSDCRRPGLTAIDGSLQNAA